MPHAQPLAFDDILPRRRDVEQQIDDMVLEQIDFVDIKEAAVRPRQQPRLERLDPGAERAFEVERADNAILGRAERQIDERHR